MRDFLRNMKRIYSADTWVVPYLKEYGSTLALAILLSVTAYLFAGALMFTSGYMISLAATIPFTVLALHVPSIFVRIFGVGKPIIRYFERLKSHDWVLKMTSRLRQRLYDTLEKKARVPAARTSKFGSMLGVFAGDIEHVQDLYLRTFMPTAVAVLIYVIVAIALGIFSPTMAIACVLMLAIVLVILPLWSLAVNGARVIERQKLVSQDYEVLSQQMEGLEDWQLSGRRDDFLQGADAAFIGASGIKSASASTERVITLVREIVYAAFACLLFIWAAYAFGCTPVSADEFFATGAVEQLRGVAMHDSVPHAANWLAAFVLSTFPLLDAFTPLSKAAEGFAQHAAAVRNLNSLDGDGSDVPVSRNAKESQHTQHTQHTVDFAVKGPDDAASRVRDSGASGGHLNGHGNTAIELHDVSFAYGDGTQVLRNFSLAVPVGSKVAIKGKSGSGKTTLFHLIAGNLKPIGGTINVNGKVGMIQQFPYIFRKSLRENMLLAKPKATDAEILDALSKVRLDRVVNARAEGLDAMMAEGGITLSGGERHRLALARILLYDADIVLLDEPFEGLDDETRFSVFETIMDVLADKTVLMISHHDINQNDFDQLITFERVGNGTA